MFAEAQLEETLYSVDLQAMIFAQTLTAIMQVVCVMVFYVAHNIMFLMILNA